MSSIDVSATDDRSASRLAAGNSRHAVQFYVDDESLAESVARFVGAGVGAGESAVVIATPGHRAALQARLTQNGVDVHRACASGQLELLDARETLDRLLAGPCPDAAKFRAVIGGVLDGCRQARPKGGLRAYGEMVDLLCREGRRDAAIQLEELWNQLAKERVFSLLCSYSMENFQNHADRAGFEAVCDTHTAVFPTERYWEIESQDERLREITRLQQRAAALESEVGRRGLLEQELRDSHRALQDFVDNAVVALHCVGADGKVLWANRAELAMLGYQADEYVGRHIADFHADAEAIRDILVRLGRNETLHDYPARLRCKDGSIKDVAISSNVLWQDGKFVHTRCFTRDVSAQRQAERQLQESEQARSRALAREREARAAAEAANRAKDEFLAMLGHELRNPLAPILTADGYELAEQLRSMPGLAATRLIAVTGYGQEGDRRRSRSAGFDAHLVKPVDLDRLASVLESFGQPRRT